MKKTKNVPSEQENERKHGKLTGWIIAHKTATIITTAAFVLAAVGGSLAAVWAGSHNVPLTDEMSVETASESGTTETHSTTAFTAKSTESATATETEKTAVSATGGETSSSSTTATASQSTSAKTTKAPETTAKAQSTTTAAQAVAPTTTKAPSASAGNTSSSNNWASKYVGTPEQEQQARACAQKIADQIDRDGPLMNQIAEATRLVNQQYAYCTYDKSSQITMTAYAVFVLRRACCNGTTSALGMVLDCLGIPWRRSDSSEIVNPQYGPHQWNVIIQDGKVINADAMTNAVTCDGEDFSWTY